MSLTQIEKGIFLRLYNRGGYVLDFSTNEFDVFTFQSIGVALCEHYQVSKGRSLMSYINDNEFADNDKTKLLLDLLTYYESSRMFENECGEYAEKSEFKPIYKKCKEIANRESSKISTPLSILTEISSEINSDYIDSQIEIIKGFVDKNPTVAIGKCKELIETICKHILEANSSMPNPIPDFPKLVRDTMKCLKVMPENISDEATEAKTIKALLGNLASISNSMAELRNAYGDGHGKSSSFVGLQPRHAKLALGASSTLVLFLWETFKLRGKGE